MRAVWLVAVVFTTAFGSHGSVALPLQQSVAAGAGRRLQTGLRPDRVFLGAMYPMFRANGDMDGGGRRRRAAFLMAIDHLNDKTDGLWDDLLPHTQISFAIGDSKRDSGTAILATVAIHSDLAVLKRRLRLASGEAVVGNSSGLLDGMVGPASSGPTMSANRVLRVFGVTHLSYSATSSSLSDAQQYPYFARTPPTDDLQSQLMAVLLRTVFGWRHANALSASDNYSLKGIMGFLSAAESMNITVQASERYVKPEAAGAVLDVSAQLARLQRSACRAVVVFAQPGQYEVILTEARSP